MAYDAIIETKTYTGATPAAAAAYETALDLFSCYAGDPFTPLNDALAEAPGFVRAHILKAWMPLIGSDRPMREMAAASFHDAAKLPMNRAELGHVTAIGKVIDG